MASPRRILDRQDHSAVDLADPLTERMESSQGVLRTVGAFQRRQPEESGQTGCMSSAAFWGCFLVSSGSLPGLHLPVWRGMLVSNARMAEGENVAPIVPCPENSPQEATGDLEEHCKRRWTVLAQTETWKRLFCQVMY